MGESKIEELVRAIAEAIERTMGEKVEIREVVDDEMPVAAACFQTKQGHHIHIVLDHEYKVWAELLDDEGDVADRQLIDEGHTPEELFATYVNDHLATQKRAQSLHPDHLREVLRDLKKGAYN